MRVDGLEPAEAGMLRMLALGCHGRAKACPEGSADRARWDETGDLLARIADAGAPLGQSSLPAYRRRVLDERRDLHERIERLSSFMGSTGWTALDDRERLRLLRQWSVMREYRGILDERIAAWGAAQS